MVDPSHVKHRVPGYYRKWYELKRSGQYPQLLNRVQRSLYTQRQLDRDAGLRFQADKWPFIMSGNPWDGLDKIVIGSLNPKADGAEPADPESAVGYANGRLVTPAGLPRSAFSRKLLYFTVGVEQLGTVAERRDEEWREWSDRNRIGFDLIPHYAERFSVRCWTAPRVEIVRQHLLALEEIWTTTRLRLVILNGNPYAQLLVPRPGQRVLIWPFVEIERFPYRAVTDKPVKGEVIVGLLDLAGQAVKTLILTTFLQQARPTLSRAEVQELGRAARHPLGLE